MFTDLRQEQNGFQYKTLQLTVSKLQIQLSENVVQLMTSFKLYLVYTHRILHHLSK